MSLWTNVTGLSPVTREIKELWTNVTGFSPVTRQITEVWANDGTTPRQIYSSSWGPTEISWTLNKNAKATFENNGLKVIVSEVGGGVPAAASTSYGPITATVSIPANTRVTHRFTNSEGLTLKHSEAPVGNEMINANVNGQSYSTGGQLYGVRFETASDVKEEIKDYTSATTLHLSLSGFIRKTYYTSSSSGQVINTAYDPLGYTYEISFSKI